jgi:hypothetical protein
MKKMVIVLAVLVLQAQSADAVTILEYPENNTCGWWIVEHRLHSIKAARLEGWLLGFLSGWAETLAAAPESVVTSRDPLAGTNSTAAIEWIDEYCVQHGRDPLPEAVKHLEDDILHRQKSH